VDKTYMSTTVGGAGTPVSSAPDADQFQRDSQPQPTVGQPNAVTAPGGTRSHTGSGEADNAQHNADLSRLP
jgi:hypothetical protein